MKGIVEMTANISSLKLSDEELAKINKQTLSVVTADDVFVFKAMIADNEQDDRNYMPFTTKALQDLKSLYVGKTFVFDHKGSAEKQIARVYDTEIVTSEDKTELGENHAELIAKIYMIKTASNADLIKDIAGGIHKEISTSTVPSKLICNICGVDNTKEFCNHWNGRKYLVDSKEKICKLIIDGCKEAYELSFVVVPAQPRAGIVKTFEKMFEKPKNEVEESTNNLFLKAKVNENYIFTEVSE